MGLKVYELDYENKYTKMLPAYMRLYSDFEPYHIMYISYEPNRKEILTYKNSRPSRLTDINNAITTPCRIFQQAIGGTQPSLSESLQNRLNEWDVFHWNDNDSNIYDINNNIVGEFLSGNLSKPSESEPVVFILKGAKFVNSGDFGKYIGFGSGKICAESCERMIGFFTMIKRISNYVLKASSYLSKITEHLKVDTAHGDLLQKIADRVNVAVDKKDTQNYDRDLQVAVLGNSVKRLSTGSRADLKSKIEGLFSDINKIKISDEGCKKEGGSAMKVGVELIGDIDADTLPDNIITKYILPSVTGVQWYIKYVLNNRNTFAYDLELTIGKIFSQVGSFEENSTDILEINGTKYEKINSSLFTTGDSVELAGNIGKHIITISESTFYYNLPGQDAHNIYSEVGGFTVTKDASGSVMVDEENTYLTINDTEYSYNNNIIYNKDSTTEVGSIDRNTYSISINDNDYIYTPYGLDGRDVSKWVYQKTIL